MIAGGHRLRALSRADGLLLAEAAALLLVVRLGLLVLPFPVVRRFLHRSLLSAPGPPAATRAVDRIGWAVSGAARRLPRTTCLPEALTAYSMLRRRGHQPQLRLGVRRGGEAAAGFAAHAWVECQGVVVAGGLDHLAEFALLVPPSDMAGRSETPTRERRLGALLKGAAASWRSLNMTSTEVLEVCAKEDLYGLVHQRVSALADGDAWPQSLRDELGRKAREGAACELVRQQELRTVLDALARAGIHPILLKGAALAYTVYGHPASRPRNDTDLLVRRDQVDAVRQVLLNLGYGATLYSDGELVFCQFEMRRRDELGVDHALDVHWKISTQSAFADVLTYDELAVSAEPVPALGAHARAAGSGHALLLACLHPVMHHGNVERLLWIFDIHLLASRLSAAEFERFVELAASRRVAAICARGLTLARIWFETAIPESVVARLAAADGEPSAEYLRPGRGWSDEFLSSLRGLSGWGDRARLLREVLFPSPRYMFGVYGFSGGALGRALLPALYLHRGLHGAWKVLIGRK